jgi:glycine cleavage system regulatory protein
MATLVLTVIGDDRAGLVSALSGVIAEHGGSWERSQMSRLAGKFAGIVVVAVPDDRAEGLRQALAPLAAQGLGVTVERGSDEPPAAPSVHRLHLELVGADRPGIVHDISRVLAARQVSIEELQTATREAPMAGGMLFEATAALLAPQDVPLAELQGVLEELANELMVDLTLSQE